MVDGIDITSMSGQGADGPGPDEDLTRGETKPPVTVLVCEDEGLIRIYLVDLLEDLGFRVIEAADGGSAIEQIANTKIDLLVTDLGLPDMPGVELARHIRAVLPHLPVLFATGRGPEHTALADGKTAYLAKPFTMQTLEAAVLNLLSSDAASSL